MIELRTLSNNPYQELGASTRDRTEDDYLEGSQFTASIHSHMDPRRRTARRSPLYKSGASLTMLPGNKNGDLGTIRTYKLQFRRLVLTPMSARPWLRGWESNPSTWLMRPASSPELVLRITWCPIEVTLPVRTGCKPVALLLS